MTETVPEVTVTEEPAAEEIVPEENKEPENEDQAPVIEEGPEVESESEEPETEETGESAEQQEVSDEQGDSFKDDESVVLPEEEIAVTDSVNEEPSGEGKITEEELSEEVMTDESSEAEVSEEIDIIESIEEETEEVELLSESYNDFEYSAIDGKVTITNYKGSASKLEIPNKIKGYPVTSIGESAFYECTSLTSVTIPDSVTNIGNKAFEDCTSLTSITIPDSVTSIGDVAFAGCTNLTSITIPDSVTNIGNKAFWGCRALTSVTIPDSVTSIGETAFCSCTNLTSITIPDSVTSIGDWAFFYCTSLTSITIPDSVTSIGDRAFADCTGLTSITIGDSVTSIGDDAFSGCTGLTSITIPNSVTSIGNDAFSGCAGLTNITIGDSVTSIGYEAFRDLTNLTSITIGDSVTSIGRKAFFGCTGLTSITIPDSVTSIGREAFYECTSLTSITIPDSVTSIGSSAFSYCTSLTSITIPHGVTSIGLYAFNDCASLTSITIPESVTSIGDYAFSSCSGLTSITIPDSVRSIGNYAFRECTSLTSITIPDSVRSIGNYAFSYCTSLTSITIPDSVTSIGGSAFLCCTGLKTAGPIGSEANIQIETIYKDEYRRSGLLYYYLTDITIPDSVTSIEEGAFSDCDLTSVTIPSSVTSIGADAFKNTDITEIIIPSSVISMSNAFHNCTNLSRVTILEGATNIDELAFTGCTGLTEITIPNSVTSIGANAFSDCNDLSKIYFVGTEAEWNSLKENGIVDNGNINLISITPTFINPFWEVSFNSNGGYGSVFSMKIEKGSTGTLSKNEFWNTQSETLTVSYDENYPDSDHYRESSVTKESSYAFIGWGETRNGKVVYTDCQEITPSQNSILYAIWSSQPKIKTESITLPSATRTGYTLEGWYQNEECTGKSVGNAGSKYTPIKSETLYAKWKLNAITGVTLDRTNVTLYLEPGRYYDQDHLTATISPSNVANKNLKWSSSNTKVATVDSDGNVFAEWYGTAIITVATEDGGKKATCKVSVEEPVTDVSLNETILPLKKGQSGKLVATVSPSTATNKTLKWSSSSPTVASVDKYGKITAKSEGRTTVTATSEHGKYGTLHASCDVYVYSLSVTSDLIDIYFDASPIKKGGTINFFARNKSDYTDISNINLDFTNKKNGNTSFVSMDFDTYDRRNWHGSIKVPSNEPDGLFEISRITFLDWIGIGVLDLYNDGSPYNEQMPASLSKVNYYVGNYVSVKSVMLNVTGKTVRAGDTFTLTQKLNPSNATIKDVTWKSSNTKVATVDSNGKVTAKAVGSATITVTTKDGGKTATCKVTVKDTAPSPTPTLVPTKDPAACRTFGFCRYNGKEYWYENGVRQAVPGDPKNLIDEEYHVERGREIFDPATGAWYWLDSVYDGAKAVGKEVWMPYIYQEEKNWINDAEKLNEIVEAVNSYSEAGGPLSDMGEQVRQMILSGKGKWVRYDENGKMMKGWVTIDKPELIALYPAQKGFTYFYDYTTGLMAKGWTTIGGTRYFFDEMTGVLQQ